MNGEVVDEDALNASPFIQEVQALASRMQELEDAAQPDESVAAPDDRQSVDQALPCKVGDTVYLEAVSYTHLDVYKRQVTDHHALIPTSTMPGQDGAVRALTTGERDLLFLVCTESLSPAC